MSRRRTPEYDFPSSPETRLNDLMIYKLIEGIDEITSEEGDIERNVVQQKLVRARTLPSNYLSAPNLHQRTRSPIEIVSARCTTQSRENDRIIFVNRRIDLNFGENVPNVNIYVLK